MVLVAGVSVGVVIEVLQSFVQRDSSYHDVCSDIYGIGAGLCVIGFINTKNIRYKKYTAVIYLFMCVILLLMALTHFTKLSWNYIERGNAFPVLVDFNADWSSSFIRLRSAEIIKPSSLENEHDDLNLVRFYEGKFPGISVIEPESDWSGYQNLCFEIRSRYDRDIALVLRVHDKKHNRNYGDRYNKKLIVMPGLNQFEIALSQIENGPVDRQMDLKNIAGLILFSSEHEEQLQFALSRIYLK